ncbi:nitronate monooxygenase [Bacillus pakistanensis]|uniref:Probable nitronate monooxygenase n=1 Tax=Rossellomorea pakistanensis TaxID=992288 RepID=A0ABS2N9C6_9BACI|nr:nitronate monooxygenase [Bacillus pakistanensis]MBM7584463.1 nitronate monooxygenase [Bacillus pakistanensis]
MWFENKVTKDLKINYPIIQAGMAGGVTTSELVAAVSNAGGLGTLGAGYMSPSAMSESIQKIKQLTSKPFGVNIFIPEFPEVSEEELNKSNRLLESFRKELNLPSKTYSKPSPTLFDAQIEVVLEHKVPVCSFTFGLPPKEIVQRLKKKNIIVIGTATTVKEAILNEENGMDMVVVQGSEAGGHRGTFSGSFENAMIGTMALVPQVVNQVSIPVIAAGGIMDGRGVLASLVLGAKAVQMGTAFVTSMESGANEHHKEAILNTTEEDLVVTASFSGKPARGIQNQFITDLKEHEDSLPGYPVQNTLTTDIRREAARQNRPEWMSMWSGQNPRLSQKRFVKEIMDAIIKNVNDQIEGISKYY